MTVERKTARAQAARPGLEMDPSCSCNGGTDSGVDMRRDKRAELETMMLYYRIGKR